MTTAENLEKPTLSSMASNPDLVEQLLQAAPFAEQRSVFFAKGIALLS